MSHKDTPISTNEDIRILVVPLNWGLGHATRMIPVVTALMKEGYVVCLGGGGLSLQLLQQTFPTLETIELPAHSIDYSKNGKLLMHIVKQFPKILKTAIKANRALQKKAVEHNISLVISDSRPALFCSQKHASFLSILVTHQLYPKLPGAWSIFQSLGNRIGWRIIAKFDRCWVPDYKEAPTLSGELAHCGGMVPPNIRFIGPLSRFSTKKLTVEIEEKTAIFILLSGPEPQRSIFEELIASQLIHFKRKVVVARGVLNTAKKRTNTTNIQWVDFMESEEMIKTIAQSKTIVCRGGYSTLMDLAVLGTKMKGKKVILVPTPGQTEQEYLADYFFEQKLFYKTTQNQFNLVEAEKEALKLIGLDALSMNQCKNE